MSVVYSTFVGNIDQVAVERFTNSVPGAMMNGATELHIALQSGGGGVSDGIALYNFFRAVGRPLVLYNIGAVNSIAALAYLGAPIRKASAHATFMIHRTSISPVAASAERLQSFTKVVTLSDEITEGILRSHLTLSDQQWAIHNSTDLWLSAKEALDCGLCTEIGEFSPPPGQTIFRV